MQPSGILLVDKPAGITSAHAIRKIERYFQFEKVGHGGTLDPFATGLLILLVGEATKIARFLLSDRKAYEAEAKIGWETETGDLEGARIGEETAPAVPFDAWRDSLPRFVGDIEQIPPKYSALKVAGRRLYDYARSGEAVEIKPRAITVHALQIRSLAEDKFCFACECSGGTYIRTLAEDWAKGAGTKAHLTALRRMRIGDFSIQDSHRLEDLLESDRNQAPPLLTIPQALRHLPQIHCEPPQAKLFQIGMQNTLSDFIRSRLREGEQGAPFVLLLHGPTENPLPLALATRSEPEQNLFKLDRVFR